MGCGASANEQATTSVKVGGKNETYQPGSVWRLKLRPQEVAEAGVMIATLGPDGTYSAEGSPLANENEKGPTLEAGMKVEITVEFWYCTIAELVGAAGEASMTPVDEDKLAALEMSNAQYFLQLKSQARCVVECEGKKGYKAFRYSTQTLRVTVGSTKSQKELSTALADNVTKMGWMKPGGDGVVLLVAADKAWQHSDPPIHGRKLPTEGFHLFHVKGLVNVKDIPTPAPTPDREKAEKGTGMSAEQVLALNKNLNTPDKEKGTPTKEKATPDKEKKGMGMSAEQVLALKNKH